MLDLDYDSRIPLPMLEQMERASRSLGLPLDAIERLGSERELCAAFVAAARRGDRARLWVLAGLSEPIVTAPRASTWCLQVVQASALN
jgi:hypothetical protein